MSATDPENVWKSRSCLEHHQAKEQVGWVVVVHLYPASESSGGVVKTDPYTPHRFLFSRSRVGWEICISSTFPDDADTEGMGSTENIAI
jgi:hypothetical protein